MISTFIAEVDLFLGNEAYLHHMVLYECHVPNSNHWFEQHVNKDGAACYSPNMPAEWSFCLATNAWAWVSSRFGFTKISD